MYDSSSASRYISRKTDEISFSYRFLIADKCEGTYTDITDAYKDVYFCIFRISVYGSKEFGLV